MHDKREGQRHQAEQQKYPPHLHAKVVFGFDDYRVENADNQKCTSAYYQSFIVHTIINFLVADKGSQNNYLFNSQMV